MKIDLKPKELGFLGEITRKGIRSARVLKRANILLSLRKGGSGSFISQKHGVNLNTVYNIKNRYVNDGFESALYEKPRPGQPPKYDDTHKAQIIAQACTDAPKGAKRWSVRLLVETMKRKRGMKTINRETIRLVLKKAKLSPG